MAQNADRRMEKANQTEVFHLLSSFLWVSSEKGQMKMIKLLDCQKQISGVFGLRLSTWTPRRRGFHHWQKLKRGKLQSCQRRMFLQIALITRRTPVAGGVFLCGTPWGTTPWLHRFATWSSSVVTVDLQGFIGHKMARTTSGRINN